MRLDMRTRNYEHRKLLTKVGLVTLDGERVHYCFAADTEEGWVDVARMKDGVFVVDANGEIETDRREGKVEIVWRG